MSRAADLLWSAPLMRRFRTWKRPADARSALQGVETVLTLGDEEASKRHSCIFRSRSKAAAALFSCCLIWRTCGAAARGVWLHVNESSMEGRERLRGRSRARFQVLCSRLRCWGTGSRIVARCGWHVLCSSQPVFSRGFQLQSQQYDDHALFQRLSLIVICCGPPASN